MDVSPQDPTVVAMDVSKGTCSHAHAVDLAKKPEWYHRRPASCGTEAGSSYRPRPSSSYGPRPAPLRPEGSGARRREPSVAALEDYMNSAVYHDRNLWCPGFYDQDCGAAAESSGGEESDSGSDVIVLLSTTKEPLLCGSFIPDGVRHIIEPLSPAASSLDEGEPCYHVPQPLSSPSPDSSFSEDSSDSSVDIPLHHTRPVVLLSDLGAVYANPALLEVSSDDSDVIEVPVSGAAEKDGGFPRKAGSRTQKSPEREAPETTPPVALKRSTRTRKPARKATQVADTRRSLRRQVRKDVVGIYCETCDSDDAMEFALRSSSSDESAARPASVRGDAEGSCGDATPDRKSHSRTQRRRSRREEELPPGEAEQRSNGHEQEEPAAPLRTRRAAGGRRGRRRPEPQVAAASRRSDAKGGTRRRRKRHAPGRAGSAALFSPAEPEIRLKFARVKEEKKRKPNGFCPFVHMERRVCTVVNSQEEEATVRRGRRPTAAGSPSGCIPATSCFRPGRPGPEGVPSPPCCLCGQAANITALGDLHGPYFPAREGEQGAGTPSGAVPDGGSPSAWSPRLDECWVHEDCGIWTAGVFLVRGRLYGLEEAARLAQETTCSMCGQTGAIMGCFQKGCVQNYHYRCAIQSGCVLNDDNFSMRCPEHKKKPLTSVTRRHKT